MARTQWQSPDRQQQFEILGVQPWGGPREEPVLGGTRPRPDQRTEVLARCWALMQTAAAMAELAIGAKKTTRLEEEHCSGLPVHPYALQNAIRAHYDRHPWLSPLDVMQHACRVADRVLFLTGDRDRPDADSYPNDNAEMARRTPEVALRVKVALEAKREIAGRGAIALDDVAPRRARTERPAAPVASAPLDGASDGSTAETDDDLGPAPNDPAEWQAYARKVRRGQPKFRANLMKLYAGECCISGWSPENVLEAAHIDPHAATGNNSVANGLLLRSDLHCLFDDGLLHIDPDSLTVVLNPRLLDTPYREFHGRKLRERRDGSTPDREKLRLRWGVRS